MAAARPGLSRAAAAEPETSTQQVYDGIYAAIVERRLSPGARLREQELAASFAVSRTVVRQALQRLAQDRIVDLQHNRGAQVPAPTREQAAHVFEARRVVECELARRLAGRLDAATIAELQELVLAEARADEAGDRALAIRLSGEFHRRLALLHGNPVFVRLIDELLPTTSMLIALHQPLGRPVCVAHRHVELIAALQGGPARAASEMRRHLAELEKSLESPALTTKPLRDVFAAYRS